jgi:hypothetical protein
MILANGYLVIKQARGVVLASCELVAYGSGHIKYAVWYVSPSGSIFGGSYFLDSFKSALSEYERRTA